MFFNEAEVEGAKAQPAAEESDDGRVEGPAHKRSRRGRNLYSLPQTRIANGIVAPLDAGAAGCSSAQVAW